MYQIWLYRQDNAGWVECLIRRFTWGCEDKDIDPRVGVQMLVQDLYKAFPDIVRMYDYTPSVKQLLQEVDSGKAKSDCQKTTPEGHAVQAGAASK